MSDVIVELTTASGQTAEVTLDELEASGFAAASGVEKPKLRDIVEVRRTAKVHGVEWRVEWDWAKSTPSGVPDTRTDRVVSGDRPHQDLENATRRLVGKVVGLLMPSATEASFKSVKWTESTAIVEIEVTQPTLSKPLKLKCFLAEKTFVDEVFRLEKEAFLYADQRKREQMELAL